MDVCILEYHLGCCIIDYGCVYFRVPDEDPSGQSVILPFYEYVRIKDASRVPSEEERQAMINAIKKDKEQAMVNLHYFIDAHSI